jgi:hypothetical protein
MSRDGKYILSYEAQMYSSPTPMQLDRASVLEQHPGTEIMEFDDGLALHVVLPKYTLTQDFIGRLKADTVLESIDGQPYQQLRKAV